MLTTFIIVKIVYTSDGSKINTYAKAVEGNGRRKNKTRSLCHANLHERPAHVTETSQYQNTRCIPAYRRYTIPTARFSYQRCSGQHFELWRPGQINTKEEKTLITLKTTNTTSISISIFSNFANYISTTKVVKQLKVVK